MVALAGPPAVALASQWLTRSSPSVTASIVGLLALWCLAAGVLAITRVLERLPLASVGLRRLSWSSIAWGILGAVALLYVFTPIGLWLVDMSGLPGFESGVERLRALPKIVLLFAALTAGFVEELLYRGYAIERLASLTGSTIVATVAALAAFCLAHLPFWGVTAALFTLLPGAFLSALYLWRRNLASNVQSFPIQV